MDYFSSSRQQKKALLLFWRWQPLSLEIFAYLQLYRFRKLIVVCNHSSFSETVYVFTKQIQLLLGISFGYFTLKIDCKYITWMKASGKMYVFDSLWLLLPLRHNTLTQLYKYIITSVITQYAIIIVMEIQFAARSGLHISAHVSR